MNQQDLRHWIDSLAQDISFEYRGLWGSICPFNRNDISVCYDGNEASYTSIDDVMNSTIIDGRPLKEICTELIFE